MAAKYKVCVVGPKSLLGETLLEILEARAFPVDELMLVYQGEQVCESVNYCGEDYPVQDIDGFDFSLCHFAFFCVDQALAEAYVPQAAEAGAVVIDDSAAFRHDPDVPLVVPEVNAIDLAGYESRRIIANPNSCVIIMALALKPIYDAAGLSRVNAVTIQSVSGAGRAAVAELAQQSIGLFNHKPMESEVFPKQIAFNLLPQIGALDQAGVAGEEAKIMQELKRVLQKDDIGVNVTSVRAPIFYGHSIALHIETERKLSQEAARAVLENASGIVLYEEDDAGGYPTPMVEAAANDPVFIGRVREDVSHPHGLNFWAVADNMRKGGALNMIQIAEILIEKYLA